KVKIAVAPSAALPGSAYYRPRNRYRAPAILEWLKGNRAEGAFRVLGITNADISMPKPPYEDWGIIGLAEIGGAPAVLSPYRLRKPSALNISLRERLFRVALHELGHTAGLDHCLSPRCLMRDAEGSVVTIDESEGFCPSCAAAIRQRLLTPQ